MWGSDQAGDPGAVHRTLTKMQRILERFPFPAPRIVHTFGT
jgi:hypothetical protein